MTDFILTAIAWILMVIIPTGCFILILCKTCRPRWEKPWSGHWLFWYVFAVIPAYYYLLINGVAMYVSR